MVARRAHNPKVVGSNPASATTNQPLRLVFLCLNLIVFVQWVSEAKTVRWTVFCMYFALQYFQCTSELFISYANQYFTCNQTSF